MPSLSQLEHDVLRSLSQSRVTDSVVTLAADLWRTTADWQAWDIAPLVTWVVAGLADAGLVRYAERGSRQELVMPCDIRLTPDGWAIVGYPLRHAEAGTRDTHYMPGRPGDMTDYRNHSDKAVGGPIWKEDISVHRIRFPHHTHPYSEKEIQAMAEAAKRTYVRVTPEMEATVQAIKSVLGPAAAYQEIADEAGVPERTVKYILIDLPRLRRASNGESNSAASLKERIVSVLTGVGEMRSVEELRRVLGQGDPDHDIVHVLHSLHKQGKVDFTEGPRADAPMLIHMTKRGLGEGLNKADINAAITRTPPVEPDHEETAYEAGMTDEVNPTGDLFPVLEALRARETKRQSGDEKALAFIAAAEALKVVDPDTAAQLLERANGYNVEYPSPTESEYLRYAETHP